MSERLRLTLPVAAAAAVLALAGGSAAAETVLACPRLVEAVQVGSCPSEDELRHRYSTTCSPLQRRAGRCPGYSEFTDERNTALWEDAEGAFMGYVSCAVPEKVIALAKPLEIAVERRGPITSVACAYEGGVTLSYRTREECRIEGPGLQASCE